MACDNERREKERVKDKQRRGTHLSFWNRRIGLRMHSLADALFSCERVVSLLFAPTSVAN